MGPILHAATVGREGGLRVFVYRHESGSGRLLLNLVKILLNVSPAGSHIRVQCHDGWTRYPHGGVVVERTASVGCPRSSASIFSERFVRVVIQNFPNDPGTDWELDLRHSVDLHARPDLCGGRRAWLACGYL